MKNKKLIFVIILALAFVVSCKKTTEPEPEKPVEPTFTLSFNGAVQSATVTNATLVYQLNPDAPGAYSITLNVEVKLSTTNNLYFSVHAYDVHSATAYGSIRAKKYFIEASKCDCRDYNGVTLCDGADLTFNIAETMYIFDPADVGSYINITSCNGKTKLLAGNLSVKTVATDDANNIQIVTIAFNNISYNVLN